MATHTTPTTYSGMTSTHPTNVKHVQSRLRCSLLVPFRRTIPLCKTGTTNTRVPIWQHRQHKEPADASAHHRHLPSDSRAILEIFFLQTIESTTINTCGSFIASGAPISPLLTGTTGQRAWPEFRRKCCGKRPCVVTAISQSSQGKLSSREA